MVSVFRLSSDSSVQLGRFRRVRARLLRVALLAGQVARRRGAPLAVVAFTR
jgi:hypothetical protein